jgi:hypothetical protein
MEIFSLRGDQQRNISFRQHAPEERPPHWRTFAQIGENDARADLKMVERLYPALLPPGVPHDRLVEPWIVAITVAQHAFRRIETISPRDIGDWCDEMGEAARNMWAPKTHIDRLTFPAFMRLGAKYTLCDNQSCLNRLAIALARDGGAPLAYLGMAELPKPANGTLTPINKRPTTYNLDRMRREADADEDPLRESLIMRQTGW